MLEALPRLPDAGRLNRRSFVSLSAALVAAALSPSPVRGALIQHPVFFDYPFQLGVASGDPAPDGFVLWTRLAPRPLEGGGMVPEPVVVSWQVAEDEQMTRVVKSGTAIASPDWAHSVHVEVEGLRPDRWYWYQFKAGSEVSPKGRTRTMPPEKSLPQRLRFAFASCQHYETGYYTAYEHMLRDDVDLVIHLGDYIYEGANHPKSPRHHNTPEIYTLADYRNRYALYKSDEALKAMHAAAPWIVTPDDHEVDNNYANDISEEKNVKPADFLRRRASAYQAYYEHMPLRRASLPHGPDMKLYRRLPFGRLAEFNVLDTRQYRTDQPCDDGNKPPCPEALSPKGTIMGLRQKRWLFNGLERSDAQWNVIAQQVMMGRADRKAGPEVAYSMDQWPGYEAERRQVLEELRDRRIVNPVVLTGDIHSNWANELGTDFDSQPGTTVATEFVGTAISSSGDGPQKSPDHDHVLAENPFVKFYNRESGYVRCEVTPTQWRTDYRTVEYVTRRGAPANTRASFVVEAGRARLNRV